MNSDLFNLKFQVKGKGKGFYRRLEVYPEIKTYYYSSDYKQDMTLEYIDLAHNYDMIRLEQKLQREGYQLRIRA